MIGYEETVPLFVAALKPIEWRYTNDPAWVMRDKGERLTHNRVWLTARGQMPDDPVIHAAALVYSSDTTVLDSIITTHGLSWGFDRIFAVTMNHSVWFHRPIRFDDWVLYSTTSPAAAESRGLGHGHFFDRDGLVLATVVQEGIVKHFPASDAGAEAETVLDVVHPRVGAGLHGALIVSRLHRAVKVLVAARIAPDERPDYGERHRRGDRHEPQCRSSRGDCAVVRLTASCATAAQNTEDYRHHTADDAGDHRPAQAETGDRDDERRGARSVPEAGHVCRG